MPGRPRDFLLLVDFMFAPEERSADITHDEERSFAITHHDHKT
jgi:hypothetical protein